MSGARAKNTASPSVPIHRKQTAPQGWSHAPARSSPTEPLCRCYSATTSFHLERVEILPLERGGRSVNLDASMIFQGRIAFSRVLVTTCFVCAHFVLGLVQGVSSEGTRGRGNERIIDWVLLLLLQSHPVIRKQSKHCPSCC